MKKTQSIVWIFVALVLLGIVDEARAADLANDQIFTTETQLDGKIVIGGDFTSYNGISRNRIARINADGTLDNTFNPGAGSNGQIMDIAIQPGGEIIVVGAFTSYNSLPINRIARLNADGTLDLSFNPGTGANGAVYAVSILSNGQLIIGGDFTTYDGFSKNGIARLNTDGTLDSGFNIGTGVDNNFVEAIAIQTDGKILIGGLFDSYDGTSRNSIARLNSSGSIDSTFNPGSGLIEYQEIRSIAIQSDERILIGGDFNKYDEIFINDIARLNPDGSLDLDFNPNDGLNGAGAYSIVIQPDQKILVSGNFTTYNGVPRNGIARINSDGTIDASFDVGIGADNNFVKSTSIQSDGKIIINGNFVTYNGTDRNRIARLNVNGSVDASFGGDATAPILSQVAPISSPTIDNTPSYTFNSTEAGTISYGGDCSSTTTTATAADNTIIFNTLADGTYDNCTITVVDASNNTSSPLTVSTFTVTTKVATPIPSVYGGTYAWPRATRLSSETSGATIYYTVDGSTPSSSSSLYSENMTLMMLSGTTTLKAIAIKDGMTDSEIMSATYIIDIPKPAMPVATSVPVVDSSSTRCVTLSTATDGAPIYYTLDGSEPTTSSPYYDGSCIAIPFGEQVTLKAMSVTSLESDVMTKIFPPSIRTYRFWSHQKQGHFYTASGDEKNYIIANYPSDIWTYEGIAYNSFDHTDSGLTPIYRFWSNTKQHHFYTASEEEKNHVIATYLEDVWKYEGIAYYAHPEQQTDTTAVYRFWSDTKQGHFYTASEDEKNHIIATYPEDVWKYEGVAWYVPTN